MIRVPLPAAAVGVVGLVPFAYAVLMILTEAGRWPTLGGFPSDAAGGVLILERFGAAILGFMGGCLWGFASGPGRGPRFATLAAAEHHRGRVDEGNEAEPAEDERRQRDPRHATFSRRMRGTLNSTLSRAVSTRRSVTS